MNGVLLIAAKRVHGLIRACLWPMWKWSVSVCTCLHLLCCSDPIYTFTLIPLGLCSMSTPNWGHMTNIRSQVSPHVEYYWGILPCTHTHTQHARMHTRHTHTHTHHTPHARMHTHAHSLHTCTRSHRLVHVHTHTLTSMLVVFAKAPTGWMWSYKMMTPTMTRRQKRVVSASSNREEYSLHPKGSKWRTQNRFTIVHHDRPYPEAMTTAQRRHSARVVA